MFTSFHANPKNYYLVSGSIVVLALVLAITSVMGDAPIVDEIPHIGAGYSYITHHDHRLNPEHPPLAKDLAGLSLSTLGLNEDAFYTRFWTIDTNGQWEFGRKLIFGSGNDADSVAIAAKLPQLLFFIGSAFLILIWANQLYGRTASLIALFLFALSPTVLAHSRFVTTDMPALFGVLFSCFFFVRYLKDSSRSNLWWAGFAFGIAQLTKFSLFLLNPYFILVALIYGLAESQHSRWHHAFKRIGQTILIITIGYLLVWAVYIPHVAKYPPDLQRAQAEEVLASFGNRTLADTVTGLADKPIIRALAEYGTGFLMVVQRSQGGNTTYFLGEVRSTAWWYYFPLVYLIKEPLAFWILALIAVGVSLAYPWRRRRQPVLHFLQWARDHTSQFIMLGWIALYWYTSITSNLNIGVRHLMPVYGFTFILVAGQMRRVFERMNQPEYRRVYTGFIGVILGWYALENFSIYPYYLTYFNQTVGGPTQAYRYVVDSNLDWGQDLKRLAQWVENNKINKIHLDYFGWSDQNYYLGDKVVWVSAGRYNSREDFLRENPAGGYLAVSATFYMNSREHPERSWAWLDSYQPVTVIGNSIFVWRF